MAEAAAARLLEALRHAVAAVDPAAAVERALQAEGVADALAGRELRVLAVGKAAAAMARGAAGMARVDELIVTPADAGHPVPDERSVLAGTRALALARAVPPAGALLALISGGASALLAAPRPGCTLAEKVARVEALRRTGAPIAEVNRLRTALSAVKGGALARACAGRVVTLVTSDVASDDPRIVGSGPTVEPSRAGDRTQVVVPMAALADALAARLGVRRAAEALLADVDEAAARIDAVRAAGGGAVWLGEPTVALPPGAPPGGRATHLALELARRGAGTRGWRALVAGTDGVDGAPAPPGELPVAGAIVDGDTWDALRASGIDGQAALRAFASRQALAVVGALVRFGATGVNHADVIALLPC